MPIRFGVDGVMKIDGDECRIVADPSLDKKVATCEELISDERFIKMMLAMDSKGYMGKINFANNSRTVENAKDLSRRYFKREDYYQDIIQGFAIEWL